MIAFYLNGTKHTLPAEYADQTLLSTIRAHPTLRGTKEGCASGDCGACTVLLGEHATDDRWHYQAVNSCLLLLVQIEGKSVITVDALADLSHSPLHPAQQALIDHHGAQCGFCTPGIVMSLAALHDRAQATQRALTDADIRSALAGNLCRCTGYRPILAAARQLRDAPPVQLWHPEGVCTAGGSATITSEAELRAHLAQHPDTRLIAGGTDLALEVTQQLKPLPHLVALGAIQSLTQCEETDTALVIGAACTYTQVEPLLLQHFPEFGRLLRRLGSLQIRNLGTLGGNVANASPVGDTPPVLIALQAEVELASLHGVRTLPIHQFFLGYKTTALQPGEYLRAIRIPKLHPAETLKVFKLSKRIEDDISTVLLAIKLRVEKNVEQNLEQREQKQVITAAHTGLGGMAAIPRAAPHLEATLTGRPLTRASFDAAAQALDSDFQPISDVRASGTYRIESAKGLLIKCYYEMTTPHTRTGPPARIEDFGDAYA